MFAGRSSTTVDPLSALLELSVEEKSARGLEHTPREIAQQPRSWIATFEQLRGRAVEIRDFLSRCGVDGPVERRPTVFLAGAGTSDYIGRSLHHLLRVQ